MNEPESMSGERQGGFGETLDRVGNVCKIENDAANVATLINQLCDAFDEHRARHGENPFTLTSVTVLYTANERLAARLPR